MVLILHLIVPIEWVPYSQKEFGYYKMTPPTHVTIFGAICSGYPYHTNYSLLSTFFLLSKKIIIKHSR